MSERAERPSGKEQLDEMSGFFPGFFQPFFQPFSSDFFFLSFFSTSASIGRAFAGRGGKALGTDCEKEEMA